MHFVNRHSLERSENEHRTQGSGHRRFPGDIPVIEVLVKVGDTVAKEQSLVTLESDKATMEVPAEAAGVIELRVKLGDKVSEGAVVAVIETAAAAPAPAPAHSSAAAPAPVVAASAAATALGWRQCRGQGADIGDLGTFRSSKSS